MKLSALKPLFLTRLLREKLLVLAFIALAVFLWASSLTDRARTFSQRYSQTRAELAEQGQWLARRAQIEEFSAKSLARLDSAKTLDGIKLLSEVNRIANDVGLTSNVQADDARDEATAQFTVHSLRYTIRRAQYPVLVKFYQELQKRSPYIGIEQFSLKAEADGRQLTALFRLTAVEVKK